jgi:hypothetical protein
MSQQVYFNIDGWGVVHQAKNGVFIPYYTHIACGTIFAYSTGTCPCNLSIPQRVVEKLFALFAWVMPLPLEIDDETTDLL